MAVSEWIDPREAVRQAVAMLGLEGYEPGPFEQALNDQLARGEIDGAQYLARFVEHVQGRASPRDDGLRAAAAALDALATGQVPARADVLAGALALQTHCVREPAPSRDLLDAAAGLETLATGGTLGLDAAGRGRAGSLAALVRQLLPDG